MKRRLAAALLAASAVLGVAAPAFADDRARMVELYARGALERARRGFALGPTVGVSGLYGIDPADGEAAVTFGLGIYKFKVPVGPDIDALKESLKARLEARIKTEAKARVEAGLQPPTQQEIEGWAKEALVALEAEVFGQRLNPKLIEKPSFALDLEGAYLGSSGEWHLRATAGIGLSKITIGPTIAGQISGDSVLYVGPQVDLRLLPGKGPRSPVIDLFLRLDFAVSDRSRADVFTGGARILLDII